MSLDNVNKLLIGNIPKSLSDIISYNIDRAIKGESSQFIYGLDAYLSADRVLKEEYVVKGKKVIEGILSSSSKVKLEDGILDALPDSYYVFVSALEDGVMIGFDMDKEGCPRALYTRNFNVIRELCNMGCISNADKVSKAEQSVKGSKTINGIKNIEEVAIGVARLDFEGVVNGKQMYKLVVPQQALRVGLNNPILMTPLKAMYILSSKLDYMLENNIVRFTEATGLGVKQGVVSASEGIVKSVYAPKDVTKKLSIIESGYNYNLLRYFTYDLESSIYSKGYATFRPEMLDRLEVVSSKDVDVSRHNIDYRLLRSIYEAKITNLSLDDMYAIRFLDLTSFNSLEDKCAALLVYGSDLDGSELYTIMKQNKDIFGDLGYELKEAKAKLPDAINNLKVVNKPSVDEFKNMLSKGVVKVLTTTKKGKVMEVYASNNSKLLKEMLGKDYIKNYESPRYKYSEFKTKLEKEGFESKAQVEKLALEYGIDMGIVANNVNGNFTGDIVSNILSDVDAYISELSSKRKKTLSPTMVTVRNVYAKESKDFYITVDVDQIKAIEYAPMV